MTANSAANVDYSVSVNDVFEGNVAVHCSPVPGSFEVNVVYKYSGFFQPIDNKDASGNYVLNKAKAGSTIPVKFSLGGD